MTHSLVHIDLPKRAVPGPGLIYFEPRERSRLMGQVSGWEQRVRGWVTLWGSGTPFAFDLRPLRRSVLHQEEAAAVRNAWKVGRGKELTRDELIFVWLFKRLECSFKLWMFCFFVSGWQLPSFPYSSLLFSLSTGIFCCWFFGVFFLISPKSK